MSLPRFSVVMTTGASTTAAVSAMAHMRTFRSNPVDGFHPITWGLTSNRPVVMVTATANPTHDDRETVSVSTVTASSAEPIASQRRP